jgi:L-Ala-D/L-Glu epimerase
MIHSRKNKITRVEVYKSPIKLKEPFIISLGPLDHAQNIIVVIRTDCGLTGFGECSPFMTINGESIDTAFIVGGYLAKSLIGADSLDIEGCMTTMDKVIYANSSIKSAFDIALYDIASQYAGLPLYAFLGGKDDKTIITDYTVSIGEPEKMAADALRIVDNGFQFIKVKLGKAGEKDVERIRMIREKVGMTIPLRIDANQGWTRDEAVNTLCALEPYNIQFCEEPIARWDYMALPEVRKKSPVPVMADESCCDHHDAARLIDISACGLFNIKLGKSSGIFNALKMISLAERAGVMMQVGGFLESRLGFTASAHIALVSDNIIYYDFDSPLMFVDDPVTGGITYDHSGVVTVPGTPGLGAGVDQLYLDQLEKISVR